MNFNIDRNENYSIVTTKVEKLNAANAPELKTNLVSINNENTANIIIDLSETKYCDSSGLSAILTGNRLCKNSNGLLILCGIQSNVLKMIQIAQLDRVLNIKENLTEAVKELL